MPRPGCRESLQTVDGELKSLPRVLPRRMRRVTSPTCCASLIPVASTTLSTSSAMIFFTASIMHGIGAWQLVLRLLSRILVSRGDLRERRRVIFRLVGILRAVHFLAVVITLLRIEQSIHLLHQYDGWGKINALSSAQGQSTCGCPAWGGGGGEEVSGALPSFAVWAFLFLCR